MTKGKKRILGALGGLILTIAPIGAAADNDEVAFQFMRLMGELLMIEGIVTEHSHSGQNAQSDFTISSYRLHQAREVATHICEEGQISLNAGDRFSSLSGWLVRVFLVDSGNRPAAACRIRR